MEANFVQFAAWVSGLFVMMLMLFPAIERVMRTTIALYKAKQLDSASVSVPALLGFSVAALAGADPYTALIAAGVAVGVSLYVADRTATKKYGERYIALKRSALR